MVSELLSSDSPAQEKAEAEKYLARVYWSEHDYSACISQLERIIANYPGTQQEAYAHWLLGYSYLKLNSLTLAEAQFNIVVTQFPTSEKYEDALKRVAYLSYKNNSTSLDEQTKLFEKILDEFPNSPEDLEITRSYAQLLWAKSEKELTLESKKIAEQAFSELKEKGKNAGTYSFEAEINLLGLEMEKERLNTGSQSNDLKPFKNTIVQAEKILEDPSVPEDYKSTAKLILGEAHFFNSDFDQALEALDETKFRGKNDQTQKAFAAYMRGLTYKKKGDELSSLSEFAKTLDFEQSDNFKGNDVQSLSMEWIAHIAASKEEYKDLSKTAIELLTLKSPDSEYTKRAQKNFVSQIGGEK